MKPPVHALTRPTKRPLAMVPPGGDQFESGLDADRLSGILEGIDSAEVTVTLPKFTFSTESLELKDTLIAMGMVIPFSPGAADFSGIRASGGLFIDEAYHKTFVAVDEKGTEAAAATAIVLRESMPDPQYQFTADRPFIYLIRDRITGAILFIGREVDPSIS